MLGADGKPRAQRIAERLIELCEEGDRQAIKDVFDRIEGKTPDKIETTHTEVKRQLILPDADDRFPEQLSD